PDGSCVEATMADCLAGGGIPQDPGAACGVVACPAPAACCLVDGQCVLMMEGACVDAGGLAMGGLATCERSPCPPPPGACCHGDGTCTDGMTADACVASGGLYAGDAVACVDACGCLGDLDGSGVVDFVDLLSVLSFWGCGDCAADIDGDGNVGFTDMLWVLGMWGACP
ncbi:MAG: hypothetical protein HKO59_07860, partial [Phycisphaerales bacterium]|nr:hypothetical protein [Phycisphaerales bacterium]